MAAQKLVKQGCRWQVDDGNSIGIWNDKWLHGPSSFSVMSRPNTIPSDSRVSTLIEPSTRVWKMELMSKIFLPNDAQSILGIPLSSRSSPNKLVWEYTPNGKFTIRSAYKIALAGVVESNGESSNRENHKNFCGQFGV